MSPEAPRTIVALDFPDAARALEFVAGLDPSLCRLKVGFELFVAAGPALVEQLVERGYSVFLDLKFHDIPNTVAAACRAAAMLGVWMINLHASGGRRMMEAAREALHDVPDAPLLIGVTVLTSMDARDLAELGIRRDPAEQALFLAGLARDCGLDGVVCSAREAERMKAELGKDFLLVTPGIRPVGSDAGDQRRIVTPEEAFRMGSDYLVVGRPVTGAENPVEVLHGIESAATVL
ncbi:MAG: orotidine-5'-phosphate decarboxylase [Gammaproteobacteria bacterium]|nr:MAG: orotidine-5'-phosphate decarboxylase [Gammaproteobacteria bacterium]